MKNWQTNVYVAPDEREYSPFHVINLLLLILIEVSNRIRGMRFSICMFDT